MKKLLALFAALSLAACGQEATVIPPVTVSPNAVTDLAALQSLVASCVSAPTWSIVESSNPGFTSPRDGTITQAGVFTAPICGSAYVGTTMHVQAQCNTVNGIAPVVIAEQVLSTIDQWAAIIFPGTPSACLAKNSVTGPYPPVVVLPIGAQVAYYARATLTCGFQVTPTPPVTWPAACP